MLKLMQGITLPDVIQLQSAEIRDTFFPAYSRMHGGTRFYVTVMPRSMEDAQTLSSKYIKVISDPRHQVDTALRVVDIKTAPFAPRSFLFGARDDLVTIVGRADPCVRHSAQIQFDSNSNKPNCKGVHYYQIKQDYRGLVKGVVEEYRSEWDKLNAEHVGSHKSVTFSWFSVYLFRSENVNVDDIKWLVVMADRLGWYVGKHKNGFFLLFKDTRHQVFRGFHITKIYDAIDYMTEMNAVLRKWKKTHLR